MYKQKLFKTVLALMVATSCLCAVVMSNDQFNPSKHLMNIIEKGIL